MLGIGIGIGFLHCSVFENQCFRVHNDWMITDSYYKLKQASHYFSDEEQDEKHVLRYTAEFDFTSGVSLIRILKSSRVPTLY